MKNIREIVYSEAKKISNQKITDSSLISSLGIDSFDVMVLVTNFEEKFNVQLPDDDLKSIKTIGDLIAKIEKAINMNDKNTADK